MRRILDKHVPNGVKAQFDAAMRQRVCLIVNERSLNWCGQSTRRAALTPL